jgi:hypothetical protein
MIAGFFGVEKGDAQIYNVYDINRGVDLRV